MSGFRKAKPEQAAVKLGLYGLPGSGKTFTALLCAEGLAKLTGKRIAYIDSEHGTDFYAQTIKGRAVHPEAFDFDALYTRSITEMLESVKGLDTNVYGVVVVDSMTHVWEAAINAYNGKLNRADQIPINAWGKIKKPYKELLNRLLNLPVHVFICGRQGNEFDEDETTGNMRKVGTKMKAEGETPYEPHILIHMEALRDTKTGAATITAFVEKDRTGLLSGNVLKNPDYESLIKPILPYLGLVQATMKESDQTSAEDAEVLAEEETKRAEGSKSILANMSAKMELCQGAAEFKKIGAEITPELKKRMTTEDVATLKERYLVAQARFK